MQYIHEVVGVAAAAVILSSDSGGDRSSHIMSRISITMNTPEQQARRGGHGYSRSLQKGPPYVVMVQSQKKPSQSCRHTPWWRQDSSVQVVLGPGAGGGGAGGTGE